MHIIVLGGAGAMGRVTVRALTAYDDVDQVTIADYNEQRAHEVAAALHSSKGQVTVRALSEYPDVDQVVLADYNEDHAQQVAAALKSSESSKSSRISVRQIDVNDQDRLCKLLHGADVVLSAVDYVFNLSVLKACIREKVHYADLGGLFHKTRTLMDMNAAAEEAGITAIMGIGGTPGITNMLARSAVDKLDHVDSIKVQLGCSDSTPSRAPLVAPYSITNCGIRCIPCMPLFAHPAQ